MPYIQLNDRQFPLRPGETRVGTGATAGIRLQQAEMPGIQAVVSVTPDQRVFIRRASADASVRVNGVVLGAEPSPLLHGDKIEIGGDELLFGDDRKGGQTQYISSEALPPLALPDTPGRPARPTAATGGRLISLVDGREYAVPATGLSIGRDAGCDVVVPGGDVSRRHAEVVPGETGYVLIDQSTNGVFVNGARIARSQLLGRGDVVRVGGEEFRFHADAVAAAASPVAAAAVTARAVSEFRRAA